MQTKYLIQSKTTGDYFVKEIGPIVAWSEFLLLAMKFDFESPALLYALKQLQLKTEQFRIVPVAFKTDAPCAELVQKTGVTFTPGKPLFQVVFANN